MFIYIPTMCFLNECWIAVHAHLICSQDNEVLHAWLHDLHYEEYYPLFVQAGYDLPTISRMTPEVSYIPQISRMTPKVSYIPHAL